MSHIWNIGGATNGGTRAERYGSERGHTVYEGMPTTWEGAIGLMYPSDYAYATSSVDSICNTTSIASWYTGTAYTECAEKSWIYNNTYNQWTISPISNNYNAIFIIYSNGQVSNVDATKDNNAATPVLYLKSNVKITGGLGTENQPFTLSID